MDGLHEVALVSGGSERESKPIEAWTRRSSPLLPRARQRKRPSAGGPGKQLRSPLCRQRRLPEAYPAAQAFRFQRGFFLMALRNLRNPRAYNTCKYYMYKSPFPVGPQRDREAILQDFALQPATQPAAASCAASCDSHGLGRGGS